MGRGLGIALAVAGLACVGSAQEKRPGAVHLAFEVTTDTAKEGDSRGTAPEPGRTTDRLDLWLAGTGFTVAVGGERTAYDFAKQRVRRWTGDEKAATSDPLEAEVDGRRLEFQNRLFLAKILGEAGKRPPEYDLFELETLFGMEKEGGALRERIVRTESGAAVSFRVDGGEVVRAAWDARELDPAYADSWRRFLRHRTRMHPIVLAQVESAGRLPSELTCRWLANFARHTRTLRLTALEDGTGTLPAPPDAVAVSDDPLGRALAAAATARPPSKAQAVAKATQLKKEGGVLDAFLALMSYSLATGDDIEREMQSFLESAVARNEVQSFLERRRGADDRARAAEVRDWLAEVQAGNLRYGFVAAVWRAGACLTLGENDAACDILLALLAEHPEIAGAWHDLGWIYSRAFDAPRAWQCWEAAFRVAPYHPMLKSVADLRASLRADHPAFFR